MKKIKMLVFIVLMISSFRQFAYSEIIIEGNKRINSETIKVYGGIEDKNTYSSQDINSYLKNLYETNFFKDVQINFINNQLKVFVNEFPVINSIVINGEPSSKIQEQLLKYLSSKEKEGFIESNLASDLEQTKRAYQSLGYLLAKVNIRKEILDENSLNLIIDIERGNKVKVKKINFIGDKKIKERRLRDIIVTTEDKFWKFISKNTIFSKKNSELDKRLLDNFYKSLGYYDVNVVSSNVTLENESIELTYNIDAGDRYRISKFTTKISPSLNKENFLEMNKYYNNNIGDYYSPFKVKKILEELDLLIAKNDLQFIEHSVNEIINNSEIEIQVNVYETDRILVERIDIEGNNVTNESVIRSELLLDEGDPFSRLKLDQSLAKLKARNIFGTVNSKVKEGENKNSKVVNISVEEKPTGEISMGAGVGTDGGSFAFNVTENNWLGKGSALESFVEVNKTSLKGAVKYTDPNWNNQGNLLSYQISSTRNDVPTSGYENSITNLNVGTRYEQYRNVYFSPGLNLTSDKLTVLSSASENLKKQKGTFTDLAFNYGFDFDSRNRAFMPTSGTLSYFSQSLPVIADAASIKNQIGLSTYKELNPNIIGAVKFYAASITGLDDEDVRLSKRLKLSTRKLRGFASGKVGPKDGEDFIGGNFATALNIETNLPNFLPESTKTEVGGFLDFGNIWGIDYDSSIDDGSKIRSSAGANASWLSPLGPMTFILSKNISKGSNDVTESFKFQLGTTF